MMTLDRALLQPDGAADTELLSRLLRLHRARRAHLARLWDVYARRHLIGSRTRLLGLPNHRLVHDLPGYIVTMAAGYLVGNPVQYTPPGMEERAFAPILEALRAADSGSVDAELAVDAAALGRGVEICYADERSRPRMAQLSPLDAFVVYDDTVEHRPLLGIAITELLDAQLRRRGERVAVYTDAQIVFYESAGGRGLRETGRELHFFGGVPITEYWNNSREEGDFEPVMDLIDAYDALQSDRVNDKQQFTDSILALYGIGALSTEEDDEDGAGSGAGGDDTESGDGAGAGGGAGQGSGAGAGRGERLTPAQRLRQSKTLFMPGDGAKAEWLTKPLSESDTEVLRKSLKDDIHKLCFVPDLSDESFAGNASGVAMRFKLLGLEQLTKIKERWFREGLRSRLRLFAAFLEKRGAAAVDVDAVQISFKRSLPVNETEIAQMIQSYDGIVPRELLLSQVPFVEDAKQALGMAGE